MKIRWSWCLAMLFLLLPVALFATGQQSSKVVEIRFMSPWTADNLAGKQVAGILEKFGAEHPNIKVVHDALPSADLRTKLTVEMAANNPPNASWAMLNYAREFAKADKILDWATVYANPKYKEYKEWFDEAVLKSSTYKGIIMMGPIEAHMDGLFYNQELFNKYGFTVPKTWDDFVALAPKAKAQGLAATVTGGKDGRFAWLASALLMRTGGLDNARELAVGNAMDQWSNSKYGFPQAMQKFKQFVDAGGYPEGVLGISQQEADAFFVQEKALTYYEGQWRPGNFKSIGGDAFVNKLGRANFPIMPDMPNGDTESSVGGMICGLIIAKQYPKEQIDATIEFCKVISSPAMYGPLMAQGLNIYAGKAAWDPSKVSPVFKQTVDAFRSVKRFIPSMDTYAPPPVDLAIKNTAMPGIITGQFTVDQAVAEVQKAAVEYLKTNK
jgi:raffinose/stachyose/melibiose transport system substrate-binding protein